MNESRRRILVAGTADAVDLVRDTVGREAEVITARSVEEALAQLEHRLDAIVCSVRFDESRMFDFLLALRNGPPRTARKVVCVRASPPPLAPAVRAAIEKALEALGIETFIDFPELEAGRGKTAARKQLRAAILES